MILAFATAFPSYLYILFSTKPSGSHESINFFWLVSLLLFFTFVYIGAGFRYIKKVIWIRTSELSSHFEKEKTEEKVAREHYLNVKKNLIPLILFVLLIAAACLWGFFLNPQKNLLLFPISLNGSVLIFLLIYHTYFVLNKVFEDTKNV